MRHVTQADIANALQISRSTVKLVVGNTESPLRQKLKPETVRRIQEKAEEMGYSANYGAQMLRKRRSNLIILLNFGLHGEKSAQEIYQLGRLAHEAGYEMRSIEAHWWVGSAQSLIDQIMSFRPEGVVFVGSLQVAFESGHFHELTQRGISAISLGGAEIDGVPIVRYSATESIREITANAIRAGRRRLALLLANNDTWQRRERMEGFQSAIHEAGGEMPEIHGLSYNFSKKSKALQSVMLVDTSRVVQFQGFNRQIAAAEQVLRAPVIPDALICVNDEYAGGALRVCSQMGISVPETLCISGFGNLSFGTLGAVSMTSVIEQTEAMCEAAMKMLIARMKRPDAGQSIYERQIFPCEVVWRESSPYADHEVKVNSPISSQVKEPSKK